MSDEIKTQKIYPAIVAIMRAVGAIGKDQRNTQQNYNYRGIDQIYNAVHPHFAEHGVFSTSEVLDSQHSSELSKKADGKEQTICRSILKMRFTFFADDGSSVFTEVVGEGLDYGGDKASNKAMSAADKYAILQLLKIPTAMVDSDAPGRKAERNGDAPLSTPRGQREVTPEQLASAKDQWKTEHPGATGADWAAFVQRVTGREFQVTSVSNWKSDDLMKVRLQLEGANV